MQWRYCTTELVYKQKSRDLIGRYPQQERVQRQDDDNSE